jgi:hypothetical protein
MGKIITAAAEVKAEIETPKGTATYGKRFWEFLVDAVNAKAPVNDLGAIIEAKDLRKLLKNADDSKAATLTLEDGQFKILHGSVKAYMPAQMPAVAMELVGFLQALEDKTEKNPGGAEKVELTAKK